MPFPKIHRLYRDIIITEKIDGTSATIFIDKTDENNVVFLTGSRTQWITPENDNHGFAKWAHEHRTELLTLGTGWHRGEWWGQGIQRNYGLTEKRWSLFNVSRYVPFESDTTDPKEIVVPRCVNIVPILYEGMFSQEAIEKSLTELRDLGSYASSGFKKPEGVVIYHIPSSTSFKVTLERDDEPKGKR